MRFVFYVIYQLFPGRVVFHNVYIIHDSRKVGSFYDNIYCHV
jgi:hypothetical protein